MAVTALKNKVLSVTALETLRRCNLKYHLQCNVHSIALGALLGTQCSQQC